MRSLTVKLTLAFLLVGVIGALLVAVLVNLRLRTEVTRFLSEHDQSVLSAALGDYYAAHGSWRGVDAMLARTPQLDSYSRRSVLVDASGRVVVGGEPGYAVGRVVPTSELEAGSPITVNGQRVGAILAATPGERPGPGGTRAPPDRAFLDRVTWATAMSAIGAAMIALVVGLLLAQTLTRPLHALTEATQAMARGTLDQRVVVRSRDEIGELARSFNQMSADLARASQLRKQMTADLAHDLRTPLSILRGYTEGLQDGRLHGTPNLYTIMHGEVEHLQRLVEDLRVLSLADAGELRLNRRLVDPAALLERTGLAYMVQAEHQGIGLRVEAAGALPSVAVDTDRMTQVLNNLVSNAMRYTSTGEIVLSAAADGAQVRLGVRDTGSGIAPDDLPFVFERFYRADKARQRGEGASETSGLGLAITKALVEAHHGTLSVASAVGRGTTFTILLPVAPGTQAIEGDRRAGQRAAIGAHEA